MSGTLEKIIHAAVDKCNPSSDGERATLYCIIETAVTAGYAVAIEDAARVADRYVGCDTIAEIIRALAKKENP